MATILLVVLLGSPVVTGRAVAAFMGVTQSSGNSLSAAADFSPPVYLHAHNNPTPPTSNTNSQTTLPMNATAPTATTLYNYDTNRDASAGLLLATTSNPPQSETDLTMRQIWTYSVAQDLPAGSSVSLTMWAAMKDFGAGKRGVLEAAVLSCTSAGTGCVVVASGSVSANPWHPPGTGTWVSRTFSLGTLTSTVAAGRQLRLIIVVDDLSGDDMWLAYDTTARPSVLVVG